MRKIEERRKEEEEEEEEGVRLKNGDLVVA